MYFLGWYCIRLGIVAFSHGKDTLQTSPGVYSNIAMPKSCSAVCRTWSDDVRDYLKYYYLL